MANNEKKSYKGYRSRKFSFTLNNYTKIEKKDIADFLKSSSKCYIVGKEKGKDGTPHLQGYFELKDGKTFSAIKKIKGFRRIHIEKAKGSKQQNYTYCSKDGDFITNIEPKMTKEEKRKAMLDKMKKKAFEAEYKDTEWRPFQKKIIDLLAGEPDKRKIYWFHEPVGNTGKSYLCKYLAIKYDVIIAEGKKDNIFNQVLNMIYEGRQPLIILIDIPRTQNNYMNYGAIEQLKNGFIYSGKYEGGQAIFPIPHIICFSNEEPDMEALSADRWSIEQVEI